LQTFLTACSLSLSVFFAEYLLPANALTVTILGNPGTDGGDGAGAAGTDAGPGGAATGDPTCWTVGPLAGQLFSVGQTAVSGAYANWGGYQPKDSFTFSAAYMKVGTNGYGISTGQWADARYGLANGDG
jgi:hypothetical protein